MLKSSTLFNIYSQEKNNSNGNLKTRIGKIGLALIATAVVAVAALPSQSLINLK